MKRTLYLIASLAIALGSPIGCAGRTEKLTTTRIDVIHGTNRISLVNPKDVSIEDAEIPTPNGIAHIRGYRSSANEAAIESARLQAQAQMQMFERMENRVGDKLERLFDRAATAYGFPKPPVTVPATVVLTNAPAK